MAYIVYIHGKRKVLGRKRPDRRKPMVNPPVYKTHSTVETYASVLFVFLIFLAILAVLAQMVMH